MKRVFCIISIALGLGIFANAQNSTSSDSDDPDSVYSAELLKPGTKAPDFAILSPEGKTVKLSKFKGKYVVLDFWASWCKDCRQELPAIEAAYERFCKKGVVFIGISFDEDTDKWTNAISKYELTYRQCSELKKWKQTEISPLYHIKWIPTIYVIDPEGKVVLGTVVTEKMVKLLEEVTAKK
jgi:Peroxiredoxin